MPETRSPDEPSGTDGAADLPRVDPATDLLSPAMDLPSIGVRGDFIDRIAYLADTSMSLVTCIGYADDDRPTLVPFVDMKLFVEAEAAAGRRVAFSELITLDNMADLLSDLSTDTRSVCRELNMLTRSGSITVETARLRAVTATLRHMVEQVEGCLSDLDGIASREPATSSSA